MLQNLSARQPFFAVFIRRSTAFCPKLKNIGLPCRTFAARLTHPLIQSSTPC